MVFDFLDPSYFTQYIFYFYQFIHFPKNFAISGSLYLNNIQLFICIFSLSIHVLKNIYFFLNFLAIVDRVEMSVAKHTSVLYDVSSLGIC